MPLRKGQAPLSHCTLPPGRKVQFGRSGQISGSENDVFASWQGHNTFKAYAQRSMVVWGLGKGRDDKVENRELGQRNYSILHIDTVMVDTSRYTLTKTRMNNIKSES